MKELLEMSFQISGTALILFIIVMLLGLAITSYFYFKLQDVTKWKDAYYTMAKELEIENGLYLKKDLERLKQVGNLEAKNIQLWRENATLKYKYERKDQPRDKGRFAVKKKVIKLPSTGKYQCVATPMIGVLDNLQGPMREGPMIGFTFGKFYSRYIAKDSNKDLLVLVGDDRQRHMIQSAFRNNFMLIES